MFIYCLLFWEFFIYFLNCRVLGLRLWFIVNFDVIFGKEIVFLYLVEVYVWGLNDYLCLGVKEFKIGLMIIFLCEI